MVQDIVQHFLDHFWEQETKKPRNLFYFQIKESPASLNIPTPTPAPDRGGPIGLSEWSHSLSDWLIGLLVSWFLGFVVSWFLVSWFLGLVLGFLVSKFLGFNPESNFGPSESLENRNCQKIEICNLAT